MTAIAPTTRIPALGKVVLVLGVLLTTTSSRAVVIRHDVPEEAYLKLAQEPGLQSGVVAIQDARGAYSGVLLGTQHILTVAHPLEGYLPQGGLAGRMRVLVQIKGRTYHTDYAYLHPQYDRERNCGGADLAILRITEPVQGVVPAVRWNRSVDAGLALVGVGQGKSGTGQERNEPLPRGIFRGYQNTLDFIHAEDYSLFRTDFDDGTQKHNSLARVVYSRPNVTIKGRSSPSALPLEGTGGAGDSGSGVWVQKEGIYYLLGIFTYRFYSAYGGQSAYVNLTHPLHVQWLESIAVAEGTTFSVQAD